MPRLAFYFDFSCPYAWLGFTQLEQLRLRTGVSAVLRPMLLGGVFRARGVAQNLAGTLNPARARHNADDLRRHAALFGVPLVFPAGHPVRTVTALRAMLVVGEPFDDLARRFYEAYWVRGIDLATVDGVSRVLQEAGHDAAAVLQEVASPAIKEELRSRTDEALAHGIFGAPAFVVDDTDLYWGQDRLEEVARALGAAASEVVEADRHDGDVAPVDFWFDYSSPFAYLASTRVERWFGPAARWRPMLLGAVFRAVGTPLVPLFEMSEAKRSFQQDDIARQARDAGVQLNWPGGFPLRTVLALRVTLLADPDSPRGRALAHRIFRSVWIDDQDPADPAVVSQLCDDVGLDGQLLVARASEQATKDALRQSTDDAVDAGVFGAPGFVVRPEGAGRGALFWGNDRLLLALAAARGDQRLL